MRVVPVNPDLDRLKHAMGEVISRLRRQAGLSQARLARAVGVSQSSVDQWEQSRSLPMLSVLWLVAPALKHTPSQILALVEKEMTDELHPPREHDVPDSVRQISRGGYPGGA